MEIEPEGRRHPRRLSRAAGTSVLTRVSVARTCRERNLMNDGVDGQIRDVAHTYLDLLTAMALAKGIGGECDLEAVGRAAERLNTIGLSGVLVTPGSDELLGTLDGDSLVAGAVSVIYLLLCRAADASPGGDEGEIIAWVREQLDAA